MHSEVAVTEPNLCLPVISFIRGWCHQALRGEFKENTLAHPFSTALSLHCNKHVLWIVTALGTSCWPLPLIPFLFGDVCRAEVRWSQFVLCYYSVFFLTSHHHHCPPSLAVSLSLSQVMFQVGWQSTACRHRQSRKFVSSVQKHVLTVCATSGGLFTQQSHSSQQPHDTICMTGSVLTPWNSKTVVTNETRKKKRGSTMAIVWRRLLREVLALVKEQSRAIFSFQAKKQKVTSWLL